MDIHKLIERKMRQNIKAKENNISSALKNGLNNYLEKWLIGFQKEYSKTRNDFERDSSITMNINHLYEVLKTIDLEVSIALKQTSISKEDNLSSLAIDGVEIVWSPEIAKKRNEEKLVMDTSSIMAKIFDF